MNPVGSDSTLPESIMASSAERLTPRRVAASPSDRTPMASDGLGVGATAVGTVGSVVLGFGGVVNRSG